MSDADALLDAIFADPDADTPRLVYADWLEEHGQPNCAGFIRLQVEAARHPPWSAEANRLWEGIGRTWSRLLDDEWRDAWPLTFVRHGGFDATDFVRGFPRSPLMLPVGDAVQSPATSGPIPWHVSVWFDFTEQPAPPDLDRLTPGQLDHIRVLRLTGLDDCPDVDAIITRPRFRHLHVLDLRGEWVHDFWARLFLSADGLTRLPKLLLPTTHELTDEMVRELTEHFRAIEYVPPLHRPV